MAAFDKLPKKIRKALAEYGKNLSAKIALEYYRKYGMTETLRIIKIS